MWQNGNVAMGNRLPVAYRMGLGLMPFTQCQLTQFTRPSPSVLTWPGYASHIEAMRIVDLKVLFYNGSLRLTFAIDR